MKQFIVVVALFLAENVMAMASRPVDPSTPPPPAWVQWAPIFFVFGIMYFLFIRPQNKQRREQQNMLSALKKGDKVVTQGGLIATIVNISPTTLEVKINDETKAKILRSAVTQVYVEPEATVVNS